MTNAKRVVTEKVQEPLRYYIDPYPGVSLHKLLVALVAVDNAGGSRCEVVGVVDLELLHRQLEVGGLFLPIDRVLFLRQTTTAVEHSFTKKQIVTDRCFDPSQRTLLVIPGRTVWASTRIFSKTSARINKTRTNERSFSKSDASDEFLQIGCGDRVPAGIQRVFHCYTLSVGSDSPSVTVTEFPTYSNTVALEQLSGVFGWCSQNCLDWTLEVLHVKAEELVSLWSVKSKDTLICSLLMVCGNLDMEGKGHATVNGQRTDQQRNRIVNTWK